MKHSELRTLIEELHDRVIRLEEQREELEKRVQVIEAWKMVTPGMGSNPVVHPVPVTIQLTPSWMDNPRVICNLSERNPDDISIENKT